MKYNYIAVEGNIGAGKTSLAGILARELQAKLALENFNKNPFLETFYKSSHSNAFPVEMFFLYERYRHLSKAVSKKQRLVSDFSFAKTKVFARNNLSKHEFRLFDNYYRLMNDSLPQPDILIYLHSNVERLLLNIKKRGRAMEQNIAAEYLIELEKRYAAFLKSESRTTTLCIDVTGSDFLQNKNDLQKIFDLLSSRHSKKMTRIKL